MPAGLIVIAEDNPGLRRLYRDILSEQGYTVLSATDGYEALSLLTANVPKAIILDVMMPGMSGIEVCRRVRPQVGFKVPILFLTSLDDTDTLRECIAAGGDDFLVKNGALDILIHRINTWTTPQRRRMSEVKRRRVLQGIEEVEADGAAAPAPAGSGLRGIADDDPAVRRVVEFARRARAAAGPGFGRTVEQKLRLLGYAAGLVDLVGADDINVKFRFRDYLEAVMRATGWLSELEIDTMFEAWSELAPNPEFMRAFDAARRDMKMRSADRAPYGLREN